ncbi:MAG: hypothetical protein RLY84_274 [Actinomycetota bacterium]
MSQASKEIDAIIASQSDWRGQKLAELRAIILKSVPEITEEVKWKMPSKPLGSPTWEVNGIVCVADYLKKAVRLTFPKGAQLSDPTGLFNARLDSKVARAIDFFETDNLEEEALEQILQDAAKRN